MNLKKIFNFNFKDKKQMQFGIGFAVISIAVWFIPESIITNVLGWINYIPILIYDVLVSKIIVLEGWGFKLFIAGKAFLEGILVYNLIKGRLR